MKIMNIEQQYELKDTFLHERVDRIVPLVMQQQNVDAWLVVSKEYHEDLVFTSLVPASYLTARRITMIAFIKINGEIKRFSLSMPDEDLQRFYPQYWQFGQEEQWDALNRLLKEYDPQSIALNISKDFTFADGLSYGLYETLKEVVDQTYVERFVCDHLIPIKVMEIRTSKELTFMKEVMDVAFSIMEEMYSTKQIIPGKTTLKELEYFMMNKTQSLGLRYWFSPTVDLQREGHDGVIYEGVIQEGDLLHCDFGLQYANQCSDTQRLAYVAKKEDTQVPLWMREGFSINNRFQDIVCEVMHEGKSGNEVLLESLQRAKEEGIEACLYSHPCNIYGHGPGPTIGLWNQQISIPLKGDIKVSNNTVYALELNTKYHYQGNTYTFFSEETVSFQENSVQFLYEGRDTIYFIK